MIDTAHALDDAAAFQTGLPHDARRQHRDIARSLQLVGMALRIKMRSDQDIAGHLRAERITGDEAVAQADHQDAAHRILHQRAKRSAQRLDDLFPRFMLMQGIKLDADIIAWLLAQHIVRAMDADMAHPDMLSLMRLMAVGLLFAAS